MIDTKKVILPVTPIATASRGLRRYAISNISVNKPNNNPFDGRIDKTITQDKELYKSELGTPVFADLTFKGSSYTDQNGKSVSFNDMTLVTVLMVVTQPKNIVKTIISGRNGSVKEYISDGDYEVSINGILNGPNGSIPSDQVRALKDILDAPIAIEVVCDYLQNLDIHNIVVQEYSFDQEPGGYSKQGFSINCLSDVPIELQISNTQ